MERVLLVGAGGSAQVISDILLRAHEAGQPVVPVGYVDDNPARQGQRILDLHVLGTIADIADIPHDSLIITIGDNRTRCRLFERLREQGERFAIARHPTAIVPPSAEIGPGSSICAGVVFDASVVIGANVRISIGCAISHECQVGNHVHIAVGSNLGGDVHVGDGTLLGVGTTVLPQRRIGSWCKVGAGAVVVDNLPDEVVAVGVPARPIKQMAQAKA